MVTMDEPTPVPEATVSKNPVVHAPQNKTILYLLIVIIVILSFGIIALIYVLNNRTPELPIVTEPNASITNTPTTSQVIVQGESMEDFIKKQCSDISSVKHLLPLRFEPGSIFDSAQNLNIVCGGGTASIQGAILISGGTSKASQDPILYVYDDASIELGHGGYPFIGPAGKKFSSDSSYDYYAFIPRDMGPLNAKSVNLYLRIIKTMTQSNGKKMYISFSTVIIPATDTRISEFTKPYLKEIDSPEFGKVTSVTDEEKYTSDFINHFLGDLKNLQEPEKTEFGKIMQLLDSFSNK